MRILILEQSEETAESLLDSLKRFGEVKLIFSYYELSKAVKESWDIIFVDLNLCKRKYDPVALVRRLSPNTKVILTTFIKDLQEVSQIFWHPCDGYICKPTKPFNLEFLVRSLSGD